VPLNLNFEVSGLTKAEASRAQIDKQESAEKIVKEMVGYFAEYPNILAKLALSV
jgi:hypothetical protein